MAQPLLVFPKPQTRQSLLRCFPKYKTYVRTSQRKPPKHKNPSYQGGSVSRFGDLGYREMSSQGMQRHAAIVFHDFKCLSVFRCVLGVSAV